MTLQMSVKYYTAVGHIHAYRVAHKYTHTAEVLSGAFQVHQWSNRAQTEIGSVISQLSTEHREVT